MKIFLPFFVFSMACLQAFAQDINTQSLTQRNSISIKQAWEEVLKNHEGIKSSEFGVQRKQKLSQASKLSFLPLIDISGFYMHMSKPLEIDLIQDKTAFSQAASVLPPPISGIFNSLGSPIELSKQDIIVGSLNIIYPLYVGGARIFASKIAALEAKDATLALRLKKLATFEELVKIYYGVLLNQEVLKVLESIEQGHYEHYQNTIKMQEAGQIAKIEVLSAQVAYDGAKTKASYAKDSLEVSQLALDTILSSQETIIPSSHLSVDTSKALPNSEFFVKQTLDSYPILKTLQNKALSAKEFKNLQLSRFLPQVGLFGSYLFKPQDTVLNRMIPDWYVGVGARLSLITPEGRIQKYQAAKLAELQIGSLKAQAQKDIKLLSEKTYKEVIAAIREYRNLDSSIELARENLNLQEQAFKQGVGTSTQVVDARNVLLGVLIEQKNIAYKYIISLSRLMALSNQLDMFYDYQN